MAMSDEEFRALVTRLRAEYPDEHVIVNEHNEVVAHGTNATDTIMQYQETHPPAADEEGSLLHITPADSDESLPIYRSRGHGCLKRTLSPEAVAFMARLRAEYPGEHVFTDDNDVVVAHGTGSREDVMATIPDGTGALLYISPTDE